MRRTVTLAFAWVAALQAAAQDTPETYTLSGEDSRGNAVEGWLRIEAEGQIDYYARAGGKLQRLTVQATSTDGVLRGSKEDSAGIMGGLLGAQVEGGESLAVRPTGDEVDVEFARGSYLAHTRGVRDTARYDLKLLRNEVPHAWFRHETSTRSIEPQESSSSEVVSYESRTNATHERRIYEEVSTDGKQQVEAGTTQTLRRQGERWEPRWSPDLVRAKRNGLLASTFQPGGITQFMPEEAVAVGQTWTLPPEEGARLLGFEGEGASGKVGGQLVGVDAVEGGLRYRIALSFDLRVNLPGLQGPATLIVRLRVSQSPDLHTVHGRLRFAGKLAFDGSLHSKSIKQSLVQRTLR